MCCTVIGGYIKGMSALAAESFREFIQLFFFWSHASALGHLLGTGDLAEGKKKKKTKVLP